MTTPGEPLGAFRTPLGAIEANLLITGLEAVVAIQVIRNFFGATLLPDFPSQWQWAYALWGLLGLVAVLLLGLLTEALAGLLEIVLTRRWAGLSWSGLATYLGGNPELRSWWSQLVDQPSDWSLAQRWIWKSPQAGEEFARRRVRLLVGRNTAFLVLATVLVIATRLVVARPYHWSVRLAVVLAVGLPLTMLFAWVWISAHQGWNRAVQDAKDIGPP